MPSFAYTTRTPCRTPLYNRGASFFDCNSPCSCNRILIVSKECVTVTAPHAAIPPAMNEPTVVDMVWCLSRRAGSSSPSSSSSSSSSIHFPLPGIDTDAALYG
jgi:hypothetical protein